MVFIEGAAALVHQGVLLPRLGHQHHHGVGDGVTGGGQEFQRVVKGGGVGLAFKADGVEFFQVIAQHGRLHHAFSGAHPVEVAAHGVDLAVVRHIAVGVGEGPLGEGVGGKALVHQGQGRDALGVLQIQIVIAHLRGQQQAFVHHGAAAHAGHVVFFAVLQTQVLDRGAGGFADDVELALQRVGHRNVGTPANENLPNDGLFFAHERRHRHLAVDRHIAPANDYLTFGFDRALQLLLAGQAGGMLFGQKDHAHAVFAGGGQLDARATGGAYPMLGHVFPVKIVRQLDQNPRAVTTQLVRAHRAPVVQVLQNFQTVLDDGVRFGTLHMRHKTHPASVFLAGALVHTVCSSRCDFFI